MRVTNMGTSIVLRDKDNEGIFGKEYRWGSRGIFFFNDTATTEIYTLSLHDALLI